VKQGDEGGDAGVEQIIDELDIVVDSLLVDRVIAAAEGNDARPRDGKAVGSGTEVLEKGDILIRAVVRVAGYRAGAAVGDLAGNGAESVPDGRSTATLVGGALDLIAVLAALA
jgi:hypothetical protein